MTPGRAHAPHATERSSSARTAAAVVAFYAALAVWSVRAVLPEPASTFPFPRIVGPQGQGMQMIVRTDQKLTAARIAENAQHWLRAPWRLMEGRQCFPFPASLTLGEHVFGAGLLGSLPYLLTRDPILTYNVVLPLTFVIAALAMYALVYAWTGSAAAALVAGALFGFHPMRLGDPAHPVVAGNQWTPLALLAAHRLFTFRRWRDAAALTLFVGLQMLESIYPLLALAILGGTYGFYLLCRNRRALPALAPKLLASGAILALGGMLLFGPYLATRRAWGGTLGGRVPLLYAAGDFGIGGAAYPGTVLLVLAVVALVDLAWRGRRAAQGYDPRPVFLVAGLLTFWCAVQSIAVPLIGLRVPSLYVLAATVFPGLDAIRAGGAVRSGVNVVAAFLAGYGVSVVIGWCRGPTARSVVTGAILAAGLAEVFYAPVAMWAFGNSFHMRAVGARPPAALLDLYRAAPEGAVLDLPHRRLVNMAEDVFLAAFHGHPVVACYNSFESPLEADMQSLAMRLPSDARAADALYALGVRSVMERSVSGGRKDLRAVIPRPAPPYLTELGRVRAGFEYALYRIESRAAVSASFAALATTTASSGLVQATPPVTTLSLSFTNGTASTYRHPDPIRPTALLARWYDGAGALIEQHELHALLPLALAPGETVVRSIPVPVPPVSGELRLTLSPAAAPALVVAGAVARVSGDAPGAVGSAR